MPKARYLSHGDPIPDGKPGREIDTRGYVRLVWRSGAGQRVFVYEHRLVMGVPPSNMHVHHINGDKGDNRPENLEVLTPAEHAERHRLLNDDEIAGLYKDGLTMEEVGRELGTDSGNVSRALARAGVAARGNGMGKPVDVDTDTVRFLYTRSVPVAGIARVLGTTRKVVSNRVRRMGLPRLPSDGKTARQRREAAEAIKIARSNGLID